MRFAYLVILALFLFPQIISAQSRPTIDFFTVDKLALDYPAVESGRETATFTWQATGLRAGDSMLMQAWVGGQWALIGEGFEAAKSDTLVIAHPLSFELPRFRLSVLDSNGQILVDSVLELPYAEAENPPSINYFLTRAYDVSPEAIQNQEGVAIHWQIWSRPYRSNLAFEQVLPDASVIAIAENNPAEWRRATGEGILYPRDTGAGEDIVLRLRVYDIDTGETLSQRDTLLPVIRRDVPAPELIRFTVTPSVSSRGGRATLSWEVSNAYRVFIGQRSPKEVDSMCLHNGGYAADIIYEDLPASGSLEIDIPEESYGMIRFQLVADRYFTGIYSCEPYPLLGEIYLELDAYNSLNPNVSYVSITPSSGLVAGDFVRFNWKVNEGESVYLIQASGIAPEVDEQRLDDLALSGTLDIRIPDTIEARQAGQYTFSAFLIRNGDAELFYSRRVLIDPDDNPNCASFVTVDHEETALHQGENVTIRWDACGHEDNRIKIFDADQQEITRLDSLESLGSEAFRMPNQVGLLYFRLYRLVDGQEIELDDAFVTVQ